MPGYYETRKNESELTFVDWADALLASDLEEEKFEMIFRRYYGLAKAEKEIQGSKSRDLKKASLWFMA